MEGLISCENGESCSKVDDPSGLIGDIITSQMIEEEKMLEEKAIQEDNAVKEHLKEEKEQLEAQCYKQLNLLLSRSAFYAEFMGDKLKRDKAKEAKKQARIEKMAKSQDKNKRKKDATNSPRKRRLLTAVDEDNENDQNVENFKSDDECDDSPNGNKLVLPDGQPSLLTNVIMHPYQIEGFEWIKNLFENGLNGILADEMGLGKTVQTIAFVAHLILMGVTGPFFVCGPLSTLPNWYAEFKRFAPDIPVILYHGTKDERKLLKSKILKKVKQGKVNCCPVIITSYQIALIDASQLARYDWKLLAIDEAHRIKNFQCKLVTSLKMYRASHRLLLTGTPLQNDLRELWSLLNFILPEIFDDLKVFESWFDISRLVEKGGDRDIIMKEQEKNIVSIIHQILTPFLLRRTKAEVDLKLPDKKEVIVHAPLTKLQREYYAAVLNKSIEDYVGITKGKYFNVEFDINSGRPKRKPTVKAEDLINQMNHKIKEEPETLNDDFLTQTNLETVPIKKEDELFSDIKLNIRNVTMILRKVCNHPYLISYPLDYTGEHKIDEDLIRNSGKFLVLDAMLPELRKRGHKILMFSQFVTLLEILEDYCFYRKYPYELLCGSTSLEERQERIKSFNESKDSFIFLISTKAGGLGVNLTAADTVIIFDSDWNPQSDLQAQDRCHRIGQEKPVVVYRLIIPNTIDEKIINRANAKRKLEKVIIKKGRFNHQGANDKLTIEELRELLKSVELRGFVKTDDNCVFTTEELNKILDRSEMS